MQHSVFKAVTVAVFYMALSLMYSAVLLLSHGSDVIKWYMTHAWLFTATLAGSVTPDVWGWTTALNTLAVALIFLAAGGFLSVATGVLMVLPGRLLAPGSLAALPAPLPARITVPELSHCLLPGRPCRAFS